LSSVYEPLTTNVFHCFIYFPSRLLGCVRCGEAEFLIMYVERFFLVFIAVWKLKIW